MPLDARPISIDVRPLAATDLDEADRIFRVAFGTFLGLPDPMSFMGDADLIRPRWRSDPRAAFGAYKDGQLIGSNFATHWGRFGFLGPLSVHPDHWGKGVAKALMAKTMAHFEAAGTRQIALFTFAQSPKHIGLYQAFDFWPRQLTSVMMKAVETPKAANWSSFTALSQAQAALTLGQCQLLAEAVYPGLDLSSEILSVWQQGLGEVMLTHQGNELTGFAICHIGAGTEAGSDTLFVKFAAVQPGSLAQQHFENLLNAVEAKAHTRGVSKLMAGVNTARHDAYRMMLDHGYKPFLQGVAMQWQNAPGYDLPDRFVIDDWR